MFSLSRALAAGVALAVSARAGTDHFILHQVRTLEYTRVDPLVNPGANGNHVHHIMGGSAFGPNTGSPESLQNSQCSSSLVGDDKSAYWAPLVYYNQGNGSYTPMVGETRIYYFLKSSDKNTPIKAFPRGHRMLAGPESNQRPATYPPRGELSYEQQQAMDPRVAAIKWGCSAGAVQGEGNGGSLPGQRPYLPNDAPNGCGVLNAGIFFPSCGDGRLDSDDHFSHMAYPVDEANGSKCPSSHPIKYPTMFMESFYFPSSSQPYRGPNKDNWVLSNGDTLGLTFHADFINGWAPGVLEDVLSQCGAPNAPGQDLEKCAPLAKSLSIDNANKCRSQGDIVIEDIGLTSPITSLPGCNPIWPVEARSKPNCKSGDMPMGPPDARVEFPEFSIALPVAKKAGQAKVEAPPAQTSSSASSSSLSSAAASTSTAAPTSTTSPTSTDASTPVSTTSSVYSDPFAAGAPATSGTSTSDAASASQTSTGYVDPYANGAPAGSGSGSSSSSASAAQPTGYADPYAMGAPSGGSSATSAPSASGAPGATPSTSVSASQPTVSNPAGVNPPANSAPASGSSSSPQKANVVGAPKPKTCVRRKNKKPHGTGQRRRDWRKRLIN